MSTAMTPPPSDAQLWNRLIRPEDSDFPAEAAKYFLTLDFSADDRAQMHALAERNQHGLLTSDEMSALEAYRRVGLQLDIFLAKARLSLRGSNGAKV